jgi:Leucine-rich repeat (LRR) protein
MQCPNLSYLNVSNNILEMLPQDYIRKCSGLTSLDVSHNPYQLNLYLFFVSLMVFNATFNDISVKSWQSVLLVEETGGPRENHRPVIHFFSG